MAAATKFLPVLTVGDWTPKSSLHRGFALRPRSVPPRRWAAAAALIVAAEVVPNETSKRRQRGITKPRPVSPELQAVVGEAEIPRTQALKKIWAYIKENNLQFGGCRIGKGSFPLPRHGNGPKGRELYQMIEDPDNKRIIICDDKLKKIFGGRDRVGFLEISGLLNPHFVK